MTFAAEYESAIGWIVGHCPAPDKFAHTYAGLTVWLLLAVIVRRPMSPTPLLAVIFAETVNECIDRVAHGAWMWRDTVGDVSATLFWPSALTLVWRFIEKHQRVPLGKR